MSIVVPGLLNIPHEIWWCMIPLRWIRLKWVTNYQTKDFGFIDTITRVFNMIKFWSKDSGQISVRIRQLKITGLLGTF